MNTGVSESTAVWSLSVMGLSGMVGRLCIGWLVQAYTSKRTEIYTGLKISNGLAMMAMPLITSFPAMIVVSVMFEFVGGSVLAMTPIIATSGLIDPIDVPKVRREFVDMFSTRILNKYPLLSYLFLYFGLNYKGIGRYTNLNCSFAV